MDLHARNSGLRDKLVAERDVVLTYALRALLDAGVAGHLAFKGGTCLRKLVFGSSGRFSEDLDFTLDSDRPEDDVLTEIVEVFNGEHHGITFIFDEYYQTDDDTSFGGDVQYRHSWNDAGRFRLQVSLRERPTLAVVSRAMQHQAYFNHLEFERFHVRSLEPIEMIAEKVRAAFQRAKVRDPFEPEVFFTKLRSGVYDWADIQRLVRTSERIEPDEILASVEGHFAAFRQLTELEQRVIADAKSGWNEPLAERLRSEIRELAAREAS